METIQKVVISKLSFPVDGYLYNAQIVRSVDSGKTFWYCGNGKFCKSREEAVNYAESIIPDGKWSNMKSFLSDTY